MTVQVGLRETWSETPETGFLVSQLKCKLNVNVKVSHVLFSQFHSHMNELYMIMILYTNS